ncbi:IS110 family transposase [Nitrosomonas ureae]|uniref:IS110 family transposase n=1 Tax=Nitrosomonas ureae TaxID=44577 RepID=UPI000721B6ED|nr:IS110 family transposase [Nitrosomonas ureae]ALQ51805.1 transposase [Nitrosomonas ureae]ALQ51943.1 transposase [Nitrosomonas ureae]ALQ51969.1 transposase [Nitrosomonas ureae]
MDDNHHGIVGGVDTHKDIHFAAVVDTYDRVLASNSFSTTRQGYKSMLMNWMQSFGEVKRIGIECTGTYGAGLLRYLQQFDVEILEVTSPDKMDRRRRGKNDTIDAENAAHAAFAGIRTVTPKTRDGMVESLRVLKVCRKTAIAARRIALQMIQMNIISAPESIREPLRALTRMQLIRTLVTWRPDLGGYRNISTAYKIALKSLARRYLELHDEIADRDVMISAIVDELAPDLIAGKAIGYESAAQLLITAGDNPDRLKSEASFAALCGVNPIPASSGKVNRHRLNRGGDRAANSALHIIAIGRLRTDNKTKEYVDKSLTQGHTKLEALRCLKRYIAREVYYILKKRNNLINSIQIAA